MCLAALLAALWSYIGTKARRRMKRTRGTSANALAATVPSVASVVGSHVFPRRCHMCWTEQLAGAHTLFLCRRSHAPHAANCISTCIFRLSTFNERYAARRVEEEGKLYVVFLALSELIVFLVEDSTTVFVWWQTGTFEADQTASMVNLYLTTVSAVMVSASAHRHPLASTTCALAH